MTDLRELHERSGLAGLAEIVERDRAASVMLGGTGPRNQIGIRSRFILRESHEPYPLGNQTCFGFVLEPLTPAAPISN